MLSEKEPLVSTRWRRDRSQVGRDRSLASRLLCTWPWCGTRCLGCSCVRRHGQIFWRDTLSKDLLQDGTQIPAAKGNYELKVGKLPVLYSYCTCGDPPNSQQTRLPLRPGKRANHTDGTNLGGRLPTPPMEERHPTPLAWRKAPQ